MDESIFRKKSLDRASSPDALNNTIKVVQPSIWILLVALILVFAAFFVWAIFGTLESTADIVAVSADGTAGCYVSEDDSWEVEPGMEVNIGNSTYYLGDIVQDQCDYGRNIDEYVAHMGDFAPNEYIYYYNIDGDVPEGTEEGKIIKEKINAISFLWN